MLDEGCSIDNKASHECCTSMLLTTLSDIVKPYSTAYLLERSVFLDQEQGTRW